MDFFKHFISNTLAGSGNQTFFQTEDGNRIYRSRTVYKVFCGGEYGYSFLFSNILDSTFGDGSFSYKNMVMDRWKIHEIKVGLVDRCDETAMSDPYDCRVLTVNGRSEKTVEPGELFYTDTVTLAPKDGGYICLEMAFSGDRIPCHKESIIPSFVLENGAWVPSTCHPFASMVGCDRTVKGKIAFIGDSITQGIGTPINSYRHWAGVVAESIGSDYAFWNLGLGYGRAEDAASDGAWLFKAKQNDIILVCYGVNDINNGISEAAIKNSFDRIIETLNACGKKVIVQTIPPFDYQGDRIAIWKNLNAYIKNELSHKAELVFDCAALLGKSENEPHIAVYGGHPNACGCKRWGDTLSAVLKAYLHIDGDDC